MADLPYTLDSAYPAPPEHATDHYPDPEPSGNQFPTDLTYGIPFSLETVRTQFELASAQRRSQSREPSQEPDFLGEISDEAGNISDADSESRDFTAEISKFKDDVRKFRASHVNDTREEGFGPAPRQLDQRLDSQAPEKPIVRPRVIKGPRKAAEPTGDIKLRLSGANEAFIKGNYDEARAIILEIIRINAETYEAWTILSAIFQELGQTSDAVMAMIYGAHLRPKDVAGWLRCAQFAQQETGENWRNYLPTATFCYSSALRADARCVEARLGKALIYLERNRPAGAISEYKYVLKIRPHDLEIVAALAAAYVDNNEIEEAKELYKETFAYLRSPENGDEQVPSWNDVNAYITLYECLGEYAAALLELKSLCRWLLGRESEEFWDEITDDDREWDSDNSRRVDIPTFDSDRFPLSTYGEGIPIELRVKMGLCRVLLGRQEEAMRHLDWLKSSDRSDKSRALEYSDLYLLVAPKLLEAGQYQNALSFYRPLKQHPSLVTPTLYIEMGKCFQGSGLGFKAEECYQMAIQIDEGNIEARMELARMYEQLGEKEQAFIYVNEVMAIKRSQQPSKPPPEPKPGRKRARIDVPPKTTEITTRVLRAYKPKHLADPVEKVKEETARAEQLQSQYFTMRKELHGMRNGDAKSRDAWLEAARDLTDDFRSFKLFYPWDKYVKFLGYTGDARLQAETSLDSDLTAMAERLSRNLGSEIPDAAHVRKPETPEDYRGLSFGVWLDIFLEYAMCLSRVGKMKEAYEMCEAAKDAVVFYHSREDMFLIHIAWCMCALICNDEETVVTVARFFMKEYQFTTDSYKMFGALSRMCQSPLSWYSSGPTQKYVLRQIKAMDYSLVDESQRGKNFGEKGSYTGRDENGRIIVNDDMDIALLMLYGHILYMGTSYAYALNYFFRAHALDPDNAMINLNIGLAYVHYALKRQSENRQHLILQGMTFLFRYYETRIQSDKVEERQEAQYNIGRVYHMLGLSHLAIPYYTQVLKRIPDQKGSLREDLMVDAAYNLQAIYAMAGNPDLVQSVTPVI